MPAKLIVQSGDDEETYWIESPVLRIGRGSSSDVLLQGPDIRDHHLTIEFRNGSYWVHNRASDPIAVGRRSAAAGSSIEFQSGQTIVLSNNLRLILKIDGDGAPSPRRRQHDGDFEHSFDDEVDEEVMPPADESSANDSPSKGASALDPKSIVQIAVISVCFLGCAGILALKMIPGEVTSAAIVLPLSDLTQMASSEWEQQVVHQLQRAERQRIQGRDSIEQFARLRDELLQQDGTTEFTKETRAFVQARLQKLALESPSPVK
jgi:hypothetical protein